MALTGHMAHTFIGSKEGHYTLKTLKSCIFNVISTLFEMVVSLIYCKHKHCKPHVSHALCTHSLLLIR